MFLLTTTVREQHPANRAHAHLCLLLLEQNRDRVNPVLNRATTNLYTGLAERRYSRYTFPLKNALYTGALTEFPKNSGKVSNILTIIINCPTADSTTVCYAKKLEEKEASRS